jgi:predicted pyridoxine 5'-phosphate oxidase superfamily flavin-nucleotide-binding protein
VKLWGEARVIENDPALITRLMPESYRARPEQAVLFTVAAWDANCPQHIPQRYEAAQVAAMLAERDQRIQALEAEVSRLRRARSASQGSSD